MRRPRRRKSEPRAVGPTIELVLEELGLEGARDAWEIARAWESLVGTDAASHSRPVAIRHGVLEIEVDASVRAQELSLRRASIVADLRERLGHERAPSDLRFRVAALS